MIIGSTALKFHFPDFPREPKDLDVIGSTNLDTDLKVEILKNPILEAYYQGNMPEYIGVNEAYTLKCSHCLWELDNGSWNKHLWDVQWLKEKGAKFIPDLFYKLFSYWETIHGKRKESDKSLNAEAFFNNAIDFPVEHDILHDYLIEHPYFQGQAKPTYSLILKEGAEVECSEEKFNQLTHKQKFNLVIEEIFVMMHENRFPPKMYWKRKYELMLKKFLISHAPLWEAIFIIQNHKQLMTQIPFNSEEFLNQQIEKYDSTTV